MGEIGIRFRKDRDLFMCEGETVYSGGPANCAVIGCNFPGKAKQAEYAARREAGELTPGEKMAAEIAERMKEMKRQ